jgi:hypothetical protein
MCDLTFIVAGLSTTLTECEQIHVLNEVIYKNFSGFSLVSIFVSDYSQLLSLGNQVICDSGSDNGSAELEEKIEM